jgi:putative beta-barrel porin BBP2
MLLPIKGWTQSVQTGLFYFTGSHQPLRRSIFREFLPGDGLKVGRVQIHPFVGVAQSFTDNVFRTNKDRKTDYGTTIAPGIQAYLPFGGRHSFLFDYRAAQLLYKNFSENNAFAQHGSGHMKLDFPGGLKFDFQGGRIDGFTPRGSELDIQDRDITKWRINSFLSQAKLLGPKGSIRLRSFYADWHYKNNGQAPIRDRTNVRADLTGFLNATSTFSPLFGVRISNNTYDENKQLDSFSYGVFTGFELAPSRLLSGEFRIGYTILNFDRAPVQQPPGSDLSNGGKQQKRLTMLGHLQWRPTSRFFLRIRPFRFISQSAVFDTSTFVQTGVRINARHILTDRLAVRGNVSYQNSDFEGGRRDNRILTRIGLDYRTVNWLGFQLDYLFGKRFSNESRFRFYSNTILVSVQVFL